MSRHLPSQCSGVVVSNSSAYVRAALDCLDAGEAFVPLRGRDDEYRKRIARVDQIIEPKGGDPWIEREFTPQASDAVAMVAFTSGSTGQPKGVPLSHRCLKDATDRLTSVMELDASIREYVGTPCYHSMGFGRCRVVLSVGGKVYIPPHGFNPSEIARMLRAGEINALSMVPTLVRVLLENRGVFGEEAARLKWIEIGSQYMSHAEKEELRELFPNAIIAQHYGLTEASRCTFLRIDKASKRELDSVGRPVGDTEVSIDPDSGRIRIRGSLVAETMLVDGELQASVDEDGWMLTSDLGELRDGFLFFHGRADDVINCGGLKLQPHEIEAHMANALGVSAENFGVARIPDPMRGEGVLVATTPHLGIDSERVLKAALQATSSLGVQLSDGITVLEIAELPRTEVGKLQRSRLTQWYEQRAPAQPRSVRASRDRDGVRSIRSILQEAAGANEVRSDSTFVNLGGDSLSYVRVSLALEETLGYVPDDWEQRTVSELEALEHRPGPLKQVETSILLRAIAIVFIVCAHFGVFETLGVPYRGGSATVLMVVAGFNFARFQMWRAIQVGAFPILRSLWRVLLPSVLFLLTVEVVSGKFSWPTILMYSNFIDPLMNFGLGPWFIQVLLQILAILALLFSFSWVRRLAARSAYRVCLAGLAISALAVLAGPYLWDTTRLYHRTPHMFLYAFMLGCCIALGSSSRQKWFHTALLIVLLVLGVTHYNGLVLCGGLLLIWTHRLWLVWPLHRVAGLLGGASLFIYLSHFNFRQYATLILGTDWLVVQVLAGLTGGVVLWLAVEKAFGIAGSLLRRYPTPRALWRVS